MGKYLDALKARSSSDQSAKSDKSLPFGRLSRFSRTFRVLESRCPDYVDVARWQQCVEDGRAFLAKWGEQAEALGWTSADLFGLHIPPDKPRPSYRRLSRYDCTGLVWLLEGRPVVALTADTAAIENPAGNITVFRKNIVMSHLACPAASA